MKHLSTAFWDWSESVLLDKHQLTVSHLDCSHKLFTSISEPLSKAGLSFPCNRFSSFLICPLYHLLLHLLKVLMHNRPSKATWSQSECTWKGGISGLQKTSTGTGSSRPKWGCVSTSKFCPVDARQLHQNLESIISPGAPYSQCRPVPLWPYDWLQPRPPVSALGWYPG